MRIGGGRRRTLEGEEGEPSVLVLQEGPSPRRRRATAVLLVVAVLLGLYLGRDTVERWTGVEVPGPESVASLFRSAPADGGAGAADAAGRGATEPGVASAGDSAGTPADRADVERRLDSLQVRLDSLATGLERYRERHGDFVRGRLGCAGLSRGYAQMEDRFEAASRVHGRVEAALSGGPGAPGTLLERYRRLSSTTDSLARLFTASGCRQEP